MNARTRSLGLAERLPKVRPSMAGIMPLIGFNGWNIAIEYTMF